MRHAQQDVLDRWLAAERDGLDGDAEAALLQLLEGLPLAAPPAGFAGRVLVRAGLPARADAFASLPLRVGLALVLTLTAFGTLWLPPLLRLLAALWSIGGMVRGTALMLTAAGQWLAASLRLWGFLATLVQALARPFAAPQVLAVLVLALLAASLSFRFLRDQITGERNLTYVDPI